MNKICFVIMGFGKKTDYISGRTLDMDKTYKNLIKPAVEATGYKCIRSDEIRDCGIIDKCMYTLLIKADLVIADISTFNPNAIYELGIRHAVKPYATIILKENVGKIPFDIDHTRILEYEHLEKDLGVDSAKACGESLVTLIEKITNNPCIDSPMYEYIDIKPPVLSEEEYKNIIDDLSKQERNIFAISEQAKIEMINNKFDDASNLWEKANKILPNEEYFVQQHALCKYKSKIPSEGVALTDALTIIQKLDVEGNTNDPETLGIEGAINRRLYQLNNEIEYLNRAIELYGKGFKIRGDYYNGENYAFCLDLKAYIEEEDDEKIYFKIEAKKTREKVIDILETILTEGLSNRPDEKWIYASLSTCYFAINNDELSLKYKDLFISKNPDIWEIDTFESSRKTLEELLKIK